MGFFKRLMGSRKESYASFGAGSRAIRVIKTSDYSYQLVWADQVLR